MCVAQAFWSQNWKSVIILLIMNQFQQFKNLSSNLINMKLSEKILLLILKFFEFCKK